MKKKVVCSLLAAAMAVSMTACGSGSASTAASTSGSSGTSSTSAAADSSAEAASTSSGSTEAEAVTSGSTAAEAVASASTAATGESAAVKATGDKPTIAFVPKVMGQAWWDYVQKSVESWSSEAGIDVIYKGPTEIDAAAQVQIMTDLDYIPQTDLNTDEDIINFQNGLLDLPSMTLKPHDPAVLSTIQIPCDWTGKDTPTPVFDRYLETLSNGDPAIRTFLLDL